MYQVACAMLLGVMQVVTLPALFDPAALWIGLPAALFGLSFRSIRLPCGFFLGLLIALQNAQVLKSRQLAEDLVGQVLVVTADVVAVRSQSASVTAVQLEVDHPDFQGRVLASCYFCPLEFLPGQRWNLSLKLRPPTGTANPHQFDYEAWLFSNGYHALGTVRSARQSKLLGSSERLVLHQQARMAVREFIHRWSRAPDLLGALAIGDKGIDERDWVVLSATGTNHLFVISGLHVGLVTAASLLIFRRLVTNRWLVLSLVTVVAVSYAMLAGLGLPVLRALVMSTVVLIAVTVRRRVRVSNAICASLALILLVDPMASLDTGFWLSFGAVTVLVTGFAGRRAGHGRGFTDYIETLVRSQWIILIGLLPVLVFFLGQVSMVAFVANLVSIPVVAMILVPLLLAMALMVFICEPVAAVLLLMAERVLSVLWAALSELSTENVVIHFPHPSLEFSLLAVTGSLVLLLPAGIPARWLGVVLLLPVLVPRIHVAPLEMTFVDVGQGLSVLVRTSSETTVYDTGTLQSASRTVIPLLRDLGVRRIQNLVISHGDHDHAGGVEMLRQQFPVSTLFASDLPDTDQHCGLSAGWQDAGLTFTVFSVSTAGSENDRSCLLAITGNGIDVLLTGDIEQQGEELLSTETTRPVDLMSVPHHGSLSSSSPMLLNRLRPTYAVVSAGAYGRFEHPHPVVLDRYTNRHVRVLNTASSGAVTFVWQKGRDNQFQLMEIREFRREHPRIWRR